MLAMGWPNLTCSRTRRIIVMQREALPHVVIGGAPRSGTTFLCELLAKHPGVFVARPFIPEPKVLLAPHPDDVAGFRQRYSEFFADAPVGSIRVEKTSNYFENDDARERFKRVLPDTQMIFMLREPVARAYSNWLWSTRNGLETLSFAEAVAAEGSRPSPFGPDRPHVRPYDYLTRARYGSFAEAWISAIGRERIAFFAFEKAIAEPESFVDELQATVGVDPLPWSRLRTGIVNANGLSDDPPDPQLVKDLRARLAPEMTRLASLTGLDISCWGY
jgi:hypothetical protein